jgi:hypothetical protein
LSSRFTKETARFKDDLDVMKYICKEFWTALYKKQIDNLRTNHQVLYIIEAWADFLAGTATIPCIFSVLVKGCNAHPSYQISPWNEI